MRDDSRSSTLGSAAAMASTNDTNSAESERAWAPPTTASIRCAKNAPLVMAQR